MKLLRLRYFTLLIPLLASLSFADSEVIGPFGGLNNTDNSFIISANQAQDLLNVDLSDTAKSIKKRKGYGLAFTLSNATSPVHGIYSFYDSNGGSVDLYFNDRNMNVSASGGTPTVFFSTGPNGVTYQCVDSAGFAYCANTSRTNIIKVNSSTYTMLTGFTSTGTMVALTPERLVQAGFSNNPNGIIFSKSNDFTTWTLGGNPTDPISFTITSPGSSVKHITYAHGRIYWFKDSSFGYILEGATQADWRVVTISAFLGNLYNTSIFRDEILYFQGNDGHFYAYDGSNLAKLSKDIQATIDVTQGRTSNSWTQTTQSDWQAGSSTPTTYINTTITPASIVLDTATAISSFTDTSTADFLLGTYVNLDTTTVPGGILPLLSSDSIMVANATGGNDICSDPCTGPGYQTERLNFTTSYILTGIEMNVKKIGSPGNYTVTVASGAIGGTVLGTGTLLSSLVTSVTVYINVGISSAAVANGRGVFITLQPTGTCDASNQVIWDSILLVGSGFTACGSSLANYRYERRARGRQYNANASFTSQAFDNGFTTNTWIWSWANILSTGTSFIAESSVTFQTQTAASSGGTYEAGRSVSLNQAPTSSIQQFIKYSSSWTQTDMSTATVLTDMTIAPGARKRPAGTYSSAVNNAPNITAWDSLGENASINEGTISYFARSANGAFTVTSSTPAWTSVPADAIPSIATGTYFQFRSSFSITNSTQNPMLNSFTFNWFEGAASDKTYAIYHDNSNWWSVASGTGATTNNKILKFNLLNPGWYIYDIGTGGMLVRSQSLYFGSASVGKIYKFGDTDSDEGAAINSYWKSKDFSGTSPFQDKDYTRLSAVFSKVANSTATITYTIDGSSSTSYNVNLGSSTSAFIQKNVTLPQGKTGKSINVQFGNNGAEQYWEVFGAMLDETLKPWVPK